MLIISSCFTITQNTPHVHVHEVTFVTELLTLKAGIFNSPFFNILVRLATPVVVSSDSPRIPYILNMRK